MIDWLVVSRVRDNFYSVTYPFGFHLRDKTVAEVSSVEVIVEGGTTIAVHCSLLIAHCYRTPLELGILPARRGSISVAIRIARAKALKVASII